MRKRTLHGSLRGTASLMVAALLLSFPGVITPARAVVNVATGTITTTTGTPMAGVTVELHTPDGIFSVNTLTAADGTYHFDSDLTIGTNYVVEPRDVAGYNKVNGNANLNNFVYDGTSHAGINFQFITTSKTIAGHVTDTTGKVISDADINITPYSNPSASNVQARTDAAGAFTATVTGGTWFVQPVVNLSEYTQRWISETPPQRVDFASDTAAETSTMDFQVTPATGKVTVTLLNSDGSKLTSSNFVADISFRRADGVGTIRKVQAATSTVSVFLTPGIYTISAYHSDLRGKSFDPAKTTFVMTENGNVDLGTVQAEVDSAHLKGKVTNITGQALSNVHIQAIREGGQERPSSNTDSSGNFDLTVGAGTWVIGLDTNDLVHTLVTPVSATVTNGQMVSGLNLQVKDLDRTISGRVLNSGGAVVTDFVGSVYVRTLTNATRVSTPVVDGTFSLKYASKEVTGSKVVVGAQAAPGTDFAGGSEKQVTAATTVTTDLTLRAYNATLTGTLKLPNGTAVTNAGSDLQVVAVDASGNFASTDVAANGTYSLPLAAGTWLFVYDIENPDDTTDLLNRPSGQTSVTIKAGQTLTRNLTIRQGTNTITGTVRDASGTAVASVKVTADNRPSLESNGTTNPNDIVTQTTETDASGVYTTKVPNGTYLVTVGETPAVADTQLAPDGKAVKVSGGATTTVNLTFEASNAVVQGKILLNGKAEGGGTVTAYSTDGAQATATVSSVGNYSLNLNKNEKWTIVATDLKGQRLVASDGTEVTPKVGTTTKNLTVKDTGLSVPGPVTKTGNADDSLNVSLNDGTNVTLPPFALDISGTVEVTVTPTIDIDPTTLDRPASLAYDVSAFDATGREVKALNAPATITLPYKESTVVNNGLREKGLATKYWDPQTENWSTDGAAGLVDTTKNIATLTTTHLSKFSVTGTARTTPKLTASKLYSRTATNLVIEVSGSNLKGPATAKIGAVKATKVDVRSSNVARLTFPTKSVKNGTYDLTYTNADGRTTIKRTTVSTGRVLGESVARIIPR
jgi:hypothetical protein